MSTVHKAGIIGTGFIGPAHVEAARLLGNVPFVAIAEANQAVAAAERDQAQASLSRQLAVQALTQMEGQLDLALYSGSHGLPRGAALPDVCGCRGCSGSGGAVLMASSSGRQGATSWAPAGYGARSLRREAAGRALAAGGGAARRKLLESQPQPSDSDAV